MVGVPDNLANKELLQFLGLKSAVSNQNQVFKLARVHAKKNHIGSLRQNGSSVKVEE